MSTGSISLSHVPLHSDKSNRFTLYFPSSQRQRGGEKRMFGICNAMCSSSASVGEILCGVLELAKGVETIEKL